MRCPVCAAEFVAQPNSKSLPFCSPRCQQIDLGRWLGENYSLPVVIDDDEAIADDDAEPGRDARRFENN